MREIKFRAWDKERQDMFFFNFTREALVGSVIFSRTQVALFSDLIKCPNVEIMQFTGLHDLNGKEIYEGDVVRCGWFYGDDFGNEVGEIEYSNQVVKYVVGIQGAGFDLNVQGMKYCEVIGNIYENPKLLEKTK